MARTPLLSSLQSLFREYRCAKSRGLPLAALREQREETRIRRVGRAEERSSGGITRRDFLRNAGAASLALALPRYAAAAGAPRIAIVGGGIAGLNCALQLADSGIASTVYEASGRVGGRMFSNASGYWNDGQVSEWGGELIDSGHRTIRRLARRFALPLDDLLAAEPAGSEDTYFFSGQYYTRAAAEKDFAAIIDAVVADTESAPFPTTYDSYTPAAHRLDHMSILEWIESRVPGGIDAPLGLLLAHAYAPEYGADITRQSALNLLYLLGFQPASDGFSIFGESDERSHIRGGNEQLPRAIAEHLGLGQVVKPGHSLVRIRQTPGGAYRLAFELSQGGATEVTADYVVLALPFAVLRKLDYAQAGFDALKQLAIEELGRGRNSKLQLQFDQRRWHQAGPWPGVSNGSSYADTGYQSSWEVTRAQPGIAGILNHYSGGSVAGAMKTTKAFATARNALVGQDAAQALRRTDPVFPGFTALWNGKATQSLPHKSRYFENSYAYYRIGQYTRFGGYERQRQGGVFFCGEHTSTNFQGYMEGGASEGARVARLLAKRVG